MSGDVLFFLAGLAASIPLSILANLFTGRVERWWSKRSGRKADELARRDSELRARVHGFVADDVAYQSFLWFTAFSVARWLAAVLLTALSMLLGVGVLTLTADETPHVVRLFIAIGTLVSYLAFMGAFFAMLRQIGKALTIVRLVESHRARPNR